MRDFGKFFLGAILGSLVGSAVALLLAPVSGPKLRMRVYDYCTNIRDDVKNAAEQRRQELRQELLGRQGKTEE
jgi:gas vesicle protein